MAKRDPRMDAYIAKAADFAKPILESLREQIHAACPEVEETMKWSMPHFDYRGAFCGMASFKEHCAFGFWKGDLVVDEKDRKGGAAMGQFGRITKLSDLPSKAVMARYIKRAMKLNEEGVKSPARTPSRATAAAAVEVPHDLVKSLAKNRKARATFEAFSPSHRREYVQWITEAKGAETRKRRLDQTIEWLAEGKSRNWKYMK